MWKLFKTLLNAPCFGSTRSSNNIYHWFGRREELVDFIVQVINVVITYGMVSLGSIHIWKIMKLIHRKYFWRSAVILKSWKWLVCLTLIMHHTHTYNTRLPCNFDMILWMLAWLHGSNRQFFQEFYQMPPRNLQKLRRELALPSPKFRKNWNVIILFRRNMPCLLIYYIIITFQRIILIRILIMNKYIHSWHAFKECLNNEFLIIDRFSTITIINFVWFLSQLII